MKKMYVFILAFLLAASMLCACGSTEDADTTAPSIMLSIEPVATTEATTAPVEETVPTETTIPQETTEASAEPTAAGTEPAETTTQHTHSYTSTVVAPTCTTDGYTLHKCRTCGYSYKSNTSSAYGHVFTYEIHDATTTECGYVLHICRDCDYSYKDNYTDKLPTEHTHSYAATVTAPTCMQYGEGYTTYTCKTCGYSYKDNYTPQLEHVQVYTGTKAPTCVQYGGDCYACINCDFTNIDNVIPPTGHNWGDWATTLAPTVDSYGEEVRTCAVCQNTETREIEKLTPTETEPPVTEHIHDYDSYTTLATCTMDGYTTYTCKTCSDSYTGDITPAFGHIWSDWVRTKEPSTTEYGEESRSCACGEIESREAEKLAESHTHSYTEDVTNPTCTTGGYTTFTCTCGDSYTGNETDAAGHSWGEWVRTKEPTTEETGVDTRTCSICKTSETRSVDKLPAEEDNSGNDTIDTSGSYAVSEIVDIVNQYRAEVGLPALSYYSAGQEAANVRAAEIRINFSHTRPDGSDSFDYTSQYGLYGECITGGCNNAQDVIAGWMSSDSHRNQIMADFFTYAVASRNGTGWVILLG